MNCGSRNLIAFLLTAVLILVAVALGTLTAVINSPVILFLASPILFVLIGMRDYRIVVVIIVILSTLGQSRLLPSFSNFNVFNYLVLGAFLSLLLKWFIDRKPLVLPPKALGLLLIPFTIGLLNGLLNLKSLPPTASILEGVPGVEAMAYLKLVYVRPMLYVVLAILLANAIKYSKKPDRWALPIAISGAIPAIAVIGIIVGFGLDLSSLSTNWGLLGSLGLHKNSLGGALALGVAPLLFLLFAPLSMWSRSFVLIGLLVVSMALLLTFSRGGVTAAVAIWVACCAFYRRWKTLSLSILLVPALFLLMPEAITDRLLLGFEGAQSNYGAVRADDELSAGRFWIWQQLLPDVVKRPIFGAGIFGYMWSELAVSGRQMYPHNFLLATLLDLGIVGTISVLSFYVVVTKGFYRLSLSASLSPIMRTLAGAGWAMMIGTFVFGLTNSDYIPGKEQIPLWIMMAVLFAHWEIAFPKASALPSQKSAPLTGSQAPQINIARG